MSERKRLTIIGTKEFSEQIIGFAVKNGEFEFVGYFDDLVETGTIINGKPVLGKVKDAICLYKDGAFDYIFEGIGYTRFDLREFYYNMLKGKVPFANIIMPGAYVSNKAKLGEGIFIGYGSSIDDGCIVGNNVFIHGYSIIGHDNRIGDNSYLSGRINTAGFVNIGKNNFIGICVCIADHISICDNVWIGLGCIIAKNVKESGKYLSPAAKLYKIE